MFGSRSIIFRWADLVRGMLCLAAMLSSLTSSQSVDAAEEATPAPARLIDQQPFDRVTLDVANGGEAIDTLLLELPNRIVPSPFPGSGSLELRRLSEPSALYTLPWASIAKIELYEQLLLAESGKLLEAHDLKQAFEYLNFLHKNYPDLAGLDTATAKYLRQDAQIAFVDKNYEETLTVLLALYDLNPQQRGLQKFVETVTDRLISKHLADRDFAAARSVLDMLQQGFPRLKPANVVTWQNKFESGAARQLTLARQGINQEQFSKARLAVRRAIAILPEVAGADEMLMDIERLSPQIVVGVDQLGSLQSNVLDWSIARTSRLTAPRLLNLNGFGAEGGDYECDWANLSSDDTGLQLDLILNEKALGQGITAEVVALELLRQADPALPEFRADFAGLLKTVEIRGGNQVRIHWLRPHVRPESLLPLELQKVIPVEKSTGIYQPITEDESPDAIAYKLPKNGQSVAGPETIIERYYDNEDLAFADLLNGEIDVVSRVPPWQVARFQQTAGIAVSAYRLPTVHVLLPNYDKPIMGRREFRRALCYGIDRPQILNDILLGGERRAGFRVLSAPLPAGITLTDPVGYAYNQGIQPRPYEPRLAAVLSSVARNSLAKLAAMRAKAAQPNAESTDTESTDSEAGKKSEPTQRNVTPLILAHPSNPTATTACQTIKLQLSAIGIPVTLKQLAPEGLGSGDDYDLLYAELAVWEPIVDARLLLGPGGVAGHCSSSMSLALRDVDQAKNWKEVRSRLQEVHQIAFNDLPVIPLWQTVEFFAYRESLRGAGATPVTLYQNVADWQRVLQGGAR